MKTATYEQIQVVRDIANDYATGEQDRKALLAVAEAAENLTNLLTGLAMLGKGTPAAD